MFKTDEELQKQIDTEWLDGLSIDDICSRHPEYSKITYQRFLRGKKRTAWSDEKRAQQSCLQKQLWATKDQDQKNKHIQHLASLSATQKGTKIDLSDSHKDNIRKHLTSEKMRQRLVESNKSRKKYTELAVLSKASDCGVSIYGDLSDSDNSVRVVWPDGAERTMAIKYFMNKELIYPVGQQTKQRIAKEKWELQGLSVALLDDSMALVSYKGDSWRQFWCGCPNATTKRRMTIVDKAEQITSLIKNGHSLTSACKQTGVDPTTFARRLKLTKDVYQSVVIGRGYEKIIKVEGEVYYNSRLGGLLIRPDIRVEDKKLIIEVDGLHWHTEQFKGKDYHHDRALLYSSMGYKLLVFSQWEVENRRHIVDSMIANKLGKIPNKVGARKCVVVELETEQANRFFNDNHLKGRGAGKTLALTSNGEVVCAIRFHKCKEGLNVSRFCSKAGWTVNGGYSKLLTLLPNENIVNFVDRRHGDGAHLTNYGFVKINEHVGFEWTTGYEAFNRRKFLGSSGLEAGMSRYWDYGQIKFIKYAK